MKVAVKMVVLMTEEGRFDIPSMRELKREIHVGVEGAHYALLSSCSHGVCVCVLQE